MLNKFIVLFVKYKLEWKLRKVALKIFQFWADDKINNLKSQSVINKICHIKFVSVTRR